MGRAKVTFFMIAYNEEKRVRRAIQSVLNQTEPNIRLYVRNNGSTDRTGEIIREIAAQDNRVYLVENKVNWSKNNGKPFVNGKGAIDIWPIDRETLGDYVSFIDADDYLMPTFAEELLRVAQEDRAEITVCGNALLQDGQEVLGGRLPPPLHLKKKSEWTVALREFGTFSDLYNVFRAYWGKLFQRDFFLQYYDEAWPFVGGTYGGFLDTAVMLRYLKRCERLSCVEQPLYLFTLSSGSTYTNFSSAVSLTKALQAEALFEEGESFLQSIKALTPENHQFLYELNWAFCWEAIEGLRNIPNAAPKDLDRIIVMLNNRVAGAYLAQNSEMVYQEIEPVLQAVWTKSGQKMELYLRYPIRLMYLRKLMEASPDSVLLPVLILGVLCDVENQNCLGWDMLPRLGEKVPSIGWSMLTQICLNWEKRHNSLRNWWVEEIYLVDGMDGEADKLARQVKEAFEQGRYEHASEALSALSKKSPLHRDGIYYRIQLAELIGEHELAVVLAASARVLFGLDAEMQTLCWMILGCT